MINAAIHALNKGFAMGWEVLWPLILGFALSAVVQAVVSHREMARCRPTTATLGFDSRRARGGLIVLLVCRRGPRPLVVPQGREFYGRHGVRNRVNQSRRQAEHHPDRFDELALCASRVRRSTYHGRSARLYVSDVPQSRAGPRGQNAGRPRNFGKDGRPCRNGHVGRERRPAVETEDLRQGSDCHPSLFRRGLTAVWLDIVGRLLIAGAIAVWVPNTFWQSLFLVEHPLLGKLWGPIVARSIAERGTASSVRSTGGVRI